MQKGYITANELLSLKEKKLEVELSLLNTLKGDKKNDCKDRINTLEDSINFLLNFPMEFPVRKSWNNGQLLETLIKYNHGDLNARPSGRGKVDFQIGRWTYEVKYLKGTGSNGIANLQKDFLNTYNEILENKNYVALIYVQGTLYKLNRKQFVELALQFKKGTHDKIKANASSRAYVKEVGTPREGLL